VAIDRDFVDWSGNCGNLSAAVGPFAIEQGLIDPAKIPHDGVAEIRIWQANIEKTIVAHVAISQGRVQETGDFELDGVTFPAAEVALDFLQPVDTEREALFPTGKLVDQIDVAGIGVLDATMINAGIPTIFINASAIGYKGTELQEQINSDADALAKFERIRTAGALAMGLIATPEEAAARQHTPKVAFVAPAQGYTASSGKAVRTEDIELLVRALSMGKLHHAMMGTAAVAIGAAAAVPGTLVNIAAGGGERKSVTFGHPSGTLRVGAVAAELANGWTIHLASMSRSARIIMEGSVRVPPNL
jgi:probable AcnD-accessory protein PrpF